MERIKSKRQPLAEQIAAQLVMMIQSREISSEERLPNEFELAERLGVGRGTVREAVKQLAARNVLEIRRGKGTYVSAKPGLIHDPLGFDFIEDKKKLVNDLLKVRLVLEPWVAAEAACNASERELRQIYQCCERVEQSVSAGSYEVEADIEFHTAIARGTQNMVVPILIPIINQSIPLFVEFTGSKLQNQSVIIHKEIADAIARHDAEAAKSAMEKHIKENRQQIQFTE